MMSDVTELLEAFSVDGVPSDALIDCVYEELRAIARGQFSHEKPGQTLQPTALVHEAYQRLFKSTDREYDNRKQFFAAASEAMRRILVDRSRRRLAKKRGGEVITHDLSDVGALASPGTPNEILELNAALDKLRETDPSAADLVQLRFFVGLTIQEASELLDLSVRSANRTWKFARAWLHREITDVESP
jgi:RNA polymerase sigma factor (TIGR02999 family)